MGVTLLEGLDALVDMLTLTILTAYVDNVPKPNSLLIIAKPESGKTEIMKKFAINRNIAYLSDVTAFGIQRDYADQIQRGEVRHLMIPDLLKPLARKASTVNTLVTFLNSLLEEGILATSTFATSKLVYDKPVRCGLVAAIASEVFSDRRHRWEKLGFLSRMIPFSYSYDTPTVNKIFRHIVGLEYLNEKDIQLNLPKENRPIRLPARLAHSILPSTTAIAKDVQGAYGFRLQKQFQALLQASALDHKRKIVNKQDVQRILGLMDWVNLKQSPIGANGK
jgi:hypothetical protein